MPTQIRASDFEYAKLTKGKLARVETAIDQLGAKYQQILSGRMHSASVRQTDVVREMKRLDKLADAAATQFQQAPDYAKLEKSMGSLRSAIVTARYSLDNVVDCLHNIDEQMPVSERLLTPGQTNKHQYPLLHQLMEDRRLLRPKIEERGPNTASCDEIATSSRPSSSDTSISSAKKALEGLSLRSR